MVDDRTADDVHVGTVVAMTTARGLVIRRKRFTHAPTLVRVALWVMLAFSVGLGTYAPVGFALGCIVASVAGVVSLLLDAAERAIRPWLRAVRRELSVTRVEATTGAYREGALGQFKIVVDGRELRGNPREVRVQRRTAERGDAVSYPIYLMHDDAIVEITATSDADAARRLRWMLRHELGLEQTGGMPAAELASLSMGCWMALAGIAFLLGVVLVGVSGTLRAAWLEVGDRRILLAALGVGVGFLEYATAVLLGWVSRSAARRWVEDSFGFLPGN